MYTSRLTTQTTQDIVEIMELPADTRQERVTRFLARMPWFCSRSFRNILLILDQRPDAQMCLNRDAWRRLNRDLADSAIPIAIQRPNFREETDEEGNLELELSSFNPTALYDVKDTYGGPVMLQWEMSEDLLQHRCKVDLANQLGIEEPGDQLFAFAAQLMQTEGIYGRQVEPIDVRAVAYAVRTYLGLSPEPDPNFHLLWKPGRIKGVKERFDRIVRITRAILTSVLPDTVLTC